MKLAILTRGINDSLNGVGQYSLRLATELRKSGVDARVFTDEASLSTSAISRDWVYPVVKSWKGEDIVKSLAEHFKPDWVCFQYVPQMYGKWGMNWEVSKIPLYLKNKLGCRTAVTCHEILGSFSGMREGALNIYLYFQLRKLLGGVDIIFTTCAKYKETITRISQVKCSVIPVPSLLSIEVVSKEKADSYRQKYGLEEGKTLAYFGRLSEARNIPVMLKLLQSLLKKGAGYKIMFLGAFRRSNPGLFAQIERMINEMGLGQSIIEADELSERELSVHLQLADLFLFPQCDGISTRNTTLMAALAHGLPIAGYEGVSGNFEGYTLPVAALAERGNEKMLMSMVEDMLSEAQLKQKAVRNRAYYDSHFSLEKMSDEYRQHLEKAD